MYKKIVLISLLLFFYGCNGGDGSTEEDTPLANSVKIDETQYFRVISPKSCTQNNQNRFIYQVLHDSYLWADETPELDYKDTRYANSEKMLNALKSKNDKFSFIIDAQTAQNFFEEGKNNDLGIGLTVVQIDATTYGLAVKFVYPNSPADKQGVKRGDVIQFVENVAITKETIDEIADILDKQKTIELSFLQKSGELVKKRIAKETYDIQTILYSNILTNTNQTKKVGYFVFQDFIQNAMGEIDNTFATFKRNNVNELILDLRYNGGGAITVANHLASLIGGSNVAENIFNQVQFNERYSQYNKRTNFEKQNLNALNLERVFVITTPTTCSSSELVINSLKASANHMEVIQIGGTTCGKPYGFAGAGLFCDKALYAINIESKNGDGVGDYVNGLTPTCEAEDNYFKPFGDVTEASLAMALHYIDNNRCLSSDKSASNVEKVKHPTKLKQPIKFKLPEDGFKRIKRGY